MSGLISEEGCWDSVAAPRPRRCLGTKIDKQKNAFLYWPILLLLRIIHIRKLLFPTLPKQHFCVSRAQRRGKPKFWCNSFGVLNLDVVRHNDVCKKRLQLVDSEITTRAIEKQCGVTGGMRRPQGVRITHQACRPNPKTRCSGEVLTA
jgi:hypothetical protein